MGQNNTQLNYLSKRCLSWLANPFAPYRGQKLQNREKRVSESKKPLFPPNPRKGVSSQIIPISIQDTTGKWGFFDSRRPFLGWGKRVFLTPKPSFPDFGVFDPCKGQTDSQVLASLLLKNAGVAAEVLQLGMPTDESTAIDHRKSAKTKRGWREGEGKQNVIICDIFVRCNLPHFMTMSVLFSKRHKQHVAGACLGVTPSHRVIVINRHKTYCDML